MRVFEISIFLTLRKPFFEALRSQICPQKIHPIPLPPIFGILDPPKDRVFILDQGGTLASAGGGRRTVILPVPALGHKKVVETTLLRKCWLGVKNNLLWSFKRFLPIKSSKNYFGGGIPPQNPENPQKALISQNSEIPQNHDFWLIRYLLTNLAYKGFWPYIGTRPPPKLFFELVMGKNLLKDHNNLFLTPSQHFLNKVIFSIF